ncbi:MAG: CCA tRNA nucleotidyltransferase, partial [Planctomycetales bacterium]|nr:CCA tRNA nucleotidyltransferase [Planctomycetales bacterium]
MNLPNDPQREWAVEVVRRLKAAGHAALWAGGCVRDVLLGRTPKDYDVATDATPDQVLALFGRRRSLAIGAAFGVVAVRGTKAQGMVEVATFRQDAVYSDGRHPDHVTFSTPEQDAQRRDFTINGLFFDPLAETVLDFVGGKQDLRDGVVRAIGNPADRIGEDKLRMLRAVRFAAAFEFRLEAATQAAVSAHAPQIRVVSGERIAEELRRILTHESRVRGISLLRQCGLLAQTLPELATAQVDEQAWQQMQAVLAGLTSPTFPMALAALLRCAVPTSEKDRPWARRLRLSNDEADRTAFLLAAEDDVRRACDRPWPHVQRLLISPGGAELVRFGEAVASALGDDPRHLAFCREKLALPPEQLNPLPLLTGDDLVAAGLPPGVIYRTILTAVRDAQLLGQIASR